MNLFKDILSYPIRGAGKYILIIGIGLSVISDLAGLAPMIGAIAILILAGYFCSVYFQIIQSTAIGDDEAPNYPDFSSLWENIVWPYLQILGVLVASFGPAVAYRFLAEDPSFVISLGLVGFGVFYTPMAILAIAILDYFGAMSPHIVLPAIARAGWLYFAVVAFVIIIYVLSNLLVESFGTIFIVSNVLYSVVGMYALMANGRALGLIYRERQEELSWL